VARVGPPAATGTNPSQVLITHVDPSAADTNYYEIVARQDSGGNLNTAVTDSGYTWATAVKIA
jgi:predicted metal-dependent phosphotriesterase family hydrolase